MIIIVVLIVWALCIFAYMKLPKFGSLPKGKRLERIKQSPHFKDGAFKNLSETPQMTNEDGFWQMTKEYFSATNKKPPGKMPSEKTNLKELDPGEDVLVWFGHSSYFIQTEGKKVLVDPVFCGNASPFSFSVKAFEGTDVYDVNDLPEIDYLVITHDHWDHLDYKTLKRLKRIVKQVVTALGNGAHLERWGYDSNVIVELDWYENHDFGNGFVFHTLPARHFSGRGFTHKKSLWASFLLETPKFKLYIGGDGGYDSHFAEIGKQFGEIDLAILENGQYNHSWKYIHMHPNEVLQAGKDLNAVVHGERVGTGHDRNVAGQRVQDDELGVRSAAVPPRILYRL